MKRLVLSSAMCISAGAALAGAHAMPARIDAADQATAGGYVTADAVIAPASGWLVVHRTADGAKPGPVVGHAPLRKGENTDVVALLTEAVQPGEKLMLMVHGEAGGTAPGIFEYTLGATEDGPVRQDGQLVTRIITAR